MPSAVSDAYNQQLLKRAKRFGAGEDKSANDSSNVSTETSCKPEKATFITKDKEYNYSKDDMVKPGSKTKCLKLIEKGIQSDPFTGLLNYAQRAKGNISMKLTRELQHNNCLLYTSPSPRDRTRSRMPSSA